MMDQTQEKATIKDWVEIIIIGMIFIVILSFIIYSKVQ